ncbi:MAG: hypothetical protein RI979_861 [Pseudomonadota bacterium]
MRRRGQPHKGLAPRSLAQGQGRGGDGRRPNQLHRPGLPLHEGCRRYRVLDAVKSHLTVDGVEGAADDGRAQGVVVETGGGHSLLQDLGRHIGLAARAARRLARATSAPK